MKTLKRLLFLFAGISLLVTCSKPDIFNDDNLSGNDLKSAKVQPVMVTVPFEANMIGEYLSLEPSVDCGYSESEPFMYRVIVSYYGTSTHLGNFNGTFNFCCNVGTGVYGPAVTSFIAANGDELYFSNPGGQVIEGRLPDHPSYVVSYWREPFVIVGGTGRFEGATGGGMEDDYNSSLDPYTHHHWTGTLTMVKGKQ